MTIVREHLRRWPVEDQAPVFANEVGAPLLCTHFRMRVCRPALVRSGLLGAVVAIDDEFEARWTDGDGVKYVQRFGREPDAVHHVCRNQVGGLRLHDLRHSYATWLVDDGVPPNMVQRAMGHERSSTTLDLYTRRTDDPTRILAALDDDPDDPGEDDDGASGSLVPA